MSLEEVAMAAAELLEVMAKQSPPPPVLLWHKGPQIAKALRAALAEAEKAEPRRELSDEASLELAEWLAREMPPGTVINDPRWWAPRIVSAVLRAAWGKR